MAKIVYVVKAEYKDAVVRTIQPSWRKDGVFVLAKCSQRDLNYLFSVIKHQAVETYDPGKDTSTDIQEQE